MRFMVGVPKAAAARNGSAPHVYAVDGAAAADLTALRPELSGDLMPVIESAEDMAALAAEAPRLHVDEVSPALPIAAPRKFVCLGLNYVEHAKEGGNPIPDYPTTFLRVPTSLTPAEGPLIRPTASERFDYEAELAFIIGKGGRDIAKADALSHVFGYTVFNDGSVRDYQRKTTQWTAGKNFDATGALGPMVVTPDELPAGAAGLAVRTRLNGELLQDGDTADMIFDIATTIATLSEVMTLEPGDVIATGTPKGVGYARTPPIFMKPGDVVEVEIGQIGVCRNPITGA